MNYENVIERLFIAFPVLEEKLKSEDHLVGLPHCIFELLLIPYVKELCENEDSFVLTRLGDFLEEMAVCPDELVRNLFSVSFMEPIVLADLGILPVLRKYLGQNSLAELTWWQKRYAYRDLINELKEAARIGTFPSLDEFRQYLHANFPSFHVEWDSEAGEEWAFLSSPGLTVMLNVRLRLAFVRIAADIRADFPKDLHLVYVNDFASKEWFVDLDELKQIGGLVWHTDDTSVNSRCFSLDDLYWATV